MVAKAFVAAICDFNASFNDSNQDNNTTKDTLEKETS
jgi:hypothetical protein